MSKLGTIITIIGLIVFAASFILFCLEADLLPNPYLFLSYIGVSIFSLGWYDILIVRKRKKKPGGNGSKGSG